MRRSGPEFDSFESGILQAVRRECTLESLREEPLIKIYRDLLWSVGVDPTKIRPSAEALLRRVLRGSSLPRVNNVVDSVNLASVRSRIPMGVYDMDKLAKLPLKLTFASGGEEFVDIAGYRKAISEGALVITDEKRIVNLYPCRDSEEVKVGIETRNALISVFGAPRVDIGTIRAAAERAREYVKRFAGGRSRLAITGS